MKYAPFAVTSALDKKSTNGYAHVLIPGMLPSYEHGENEAANDRPKKRAGLEPKLPKTIPALAERYPRLLGRIVAAGQLSSIDEAAVILWREGPNRGADDVCPTVRTNGVLVLNYTGSTLDKRSGMSYSVPTITSPMPARSSA